MATRLTYAVAMLADGIVRCLGGGRVLHVGAGDGALVQALIERGVDACGLDANETFVVKGNARFPGRFLLASPLSLPVDASAFETVVATLGTLDLAQRDILPLLVQLRRASASNVLLVVPPTHSDETTEALRARWEALAYRAGLRRHARMLTLVPFESLAVAGLELLMPFEVVGDAARARDPQRFVPPDALRTSGAAADARLKAYAIASEVLKPGDRVLDLGCGAGDGTWVMTRGSRAATVTGISDDTAAIEDARAAYIDPTGRLTFTAGNLDAELAARMPASLDAVVITDATCSPARLAAILRVLVPGGRLVLAGDGAAIAGVTTASGTRLIIERCVAVHAAEGARLLSELGIKGLQPVQDARDLRVLVAMKDPLDDPASYAEQVFANLAGSPLPVAHAASLYGNPWLSNAMVNLTHRVRDATALKGLVAKVLARETPGSNDALAARCVQAYLLLADPGSDALAVDVMTDAIDVSLAAIIDELDPMSFRWTVSLLFVKARLLQGSGRFASARDVYRQCAQRDARRYGVHLATKTTEAAFLAGHLSLALGERQAAIEDWNNGLHLGGLLLQSQLDDVLISAACPNLFNHGDGAREFALAWDNVARCANGLHLLRSIGEIDGGLLQGSFTTEYQIVSRDLQGTRLALDAAIDQLRSERVELVSRTSRLERANRDSNDVIAALARDMKQIGAVVDALRAVENPKQPPELTLTTAQHTLEAIADSLAGTMRFLELGREA